MKTGLPTLRGEFIEAPFRKNDQNESDQTVLYGRS
jgi:hypothetical protein